MSAQALLLLSLAVSAAPSSPAKKEALSGRALYNHAVRGTVWVHQEIKSNNGTGLMTGTGWIVDKQRKLIVTNYHVAAEGECLIHFPKFENGKVVSDRRKYMATGVKGKVIDSDPMLDLSVIEVASIPDGMHALKLAAEEPSPADRLHSVGHPSAGHGLFIYTTGTVRQITNSQIRFKDGQFVQARFIEGQVAINPGDSGSASLNEHGEVVGVNFAGAGTAASVFASIIAAEEVRAFVKDVVELRDGKQAQAGTLERRAARLLRKGNPGAALSDLNRVIQLDPKRATAYRLRAGLYGAGGNYDAALMDCYRLVELRPNDPEALGLRGFAHYYRGDYRRAVADYSRALKLAPKEFGLWTERGRTYSRLNDSERAMKDFAEAIKLNPYYLDTYWERGQLHLRNKDHKKAAADFEIGLKLSPADADLLVGLGIARQGEGRHAEAAEAFIKALQSNVGNPAGVLVRLGEARLALKQYDLALTTADLAVKSAPRSPEAWVLRGKTLEAKGEVDEAQVDFNRAVELDRNLESSLPRFSTRQVKISNTTGEPLKVFVRYERPLGNGSQARVPERDGWLEYTVKPGTTLLLGSDDRPVQTRKLRIWAVGTKSGKKYDALKNRDIVLVDGTYRGTRIDAHVHRFGE